MGAVGGPACPTPATGCCWAGMSAKGWQGRAVRAFSQAPWWQAQGSTQCPCCSSILVPTWVLTAHGWRLLPKMKV